MRNIITIFVTLVPFTTFSTTHLVERKVASIPKDIRIVHARELMGPGYSKSVVSKVEKKKNLETNILAVVSKRLPKEFKNKAREISNSIIQEATKHQLDPYFVMAVIAGESSFNPKAIGTVGEIGLMQIRPSTGEWISKMKKMKWNGDKTLRDPIMNIRLGTAYLAWLRAKFEGHSQLYLAAYNMGAKSVKKALNKNIMPKDYPLHVMKRYVAFYRDINANL